MAKILLEAFTLGLIGGALPGPALASAFTDIIKFNFKKSLRIIFLFLLAELLVAGLSVLLFNSIASSDILFYSISFIGSAVLIWLSYKLWQVKNFGASAESIFTFDKILLLTITNGMLWTFWLTICAPKAYLLESKIICGQFLFILIFEFAWLLSIAAISFIFSRFRSYLSNPKVLPIIFKLFSFIFLLFAIERIYKSLSFLLTLI